MEKADLIAELRGMDTHASEYWNDPEVWGAVLCAAITVRSLMREQKSEPAPDPSDNSGDDGA